LFPYQLLLFKKEGGNSLVAAVETNAFNGLSFFTSVRLDKWMHRDEEKGAYGWQSDM